MGSPEELKAAMQDNTLLRWLLDGNLRRFEAARTLEESRGIVYPETTCILRDCERIAEKLAGKKHPRSPGLLEVLP